MGSLETRRNTKEIVEEEEENVVIAIPLPLDHAAATFDLEKAVCSHGLFMMSPNHWDPLSRTFSRPLRLHSYDDDDDDDDFTSVMVTISHPSDCDSLHVRVYGTRSLSPRHQHSLVLQVVRMLRLSDVDERNARDFREMATAAENFWIKGFGGRVFRSPTLFEDMVKCILLCNCQWSRTLSMARALCELQVEVSYQSAGTPVAQAGNENTKTQETQTDNFFPKTPAAKESKRNFGVSKTSTSRASKFLEFKPDWQGDTNLRMDDINIRVENLSPSFSQNNKKGDSCENCKSCQSSDKLCRLDPCMHSCLQFHHVMQHYEHKRIGNFPSPRDLANLDERFLAKRCNLGYRASRIIKLARDIVEGRIPMRELEQICDGVNLSNYNKLSDQLRQINGFGSFTCANVLMCMGFYHVIPTDSETVRHLRQVHAKNCTIQTIQRDVEQIYGKYAPFQFLAYWAELWYFYEQRFGKLSEMSYSGYKLITASNMRSKGRCRNKRTKISWQSS